MKVMTMYFLGTGKHRDQDNQMLGHFYRHIDRNTQDQTKHIFDGPGSSRMHGINIFSRALGVGFGRGWKSNLEKAHKAVLSQLPGVDVVNCIGHSRGAVTCHMFAHKLRSDPETRMIPVRIFSVDPVPGGEGDFASSLGSPEVLASNVVEYLTVLMENDNQICFGVIGDQKIRASAPHTTMRKLAMPGSHGDCISYPFSAYPAAGVCYGILKDFLRRTGVPISGRVYTPAMFAELYASLWLTKRVGLGFHKDSPNQGPKYTNEFKNGVNKKKSTTWTAKQGTAGWKLGLAAGGSLAAGGVATVLSHGAAYPLLAGGVNVAILTMESDYWKNDRSQDVTNSMRGDPLYINSHHKCSLACCPEFRGLIAAIDRRNGVAAATAMQQIQTALPKTFQVLKRLGY